MINWYLKFADRTKPKVVPFKKIYNDYARANLQFEENGEWFEDVFKYILIDKIQQIKPWSDFRLKDNLNWLKKTKSMPPLRLYEDKNGTYGITDGIHRMNAAKIEGYTYVPAIVSERRTNTPPFDPNTEIRKMEDIGWKIAFKIKNLKSVDWVDVDGTTKDIIILNIVTYNKQAEYKYKVLIHCLSNNILKAELNGLVFEGNIDFVSEQIASNIKGIND